MNVEVKTQCGITLAEISGDLDHHTAKSIRTEIDNAVKEHQPKKLVLDFSSVSFMDSSGIGLVMGRYKLMQELDGEVIVVCPHGYIRKVMQIAGINKLTKIVDDPKSLLEKFRAETESVKDSSAEEAQQEKEGEIIESKAN